MCLRGNGAAPRSSGNVPGHSADTFVPPSYMPSADELAAAADIINAGTKVCILAGRGCLAARDEVLQLAERTGGVIIKPLLGKGVVPDDSAYTTGGIGLLGTKPSQEAMENCDTLFMIGTSFPYIEFLPKPGQARAIQLELDGTRIGLRYPVEVGLVGSGRLDVKALSGSVTVSVPRGARPTTRLKALSGDVRCDCPDGGEGEIKVKTLSGNIRVVER